MEGGPVLSASLTGTAELVLGECGQLPTTTNDTKNKLIKRKSNFPHILHKEIQKGSDAKSYMTNGLLRNRFHLKFPIYEENFSFFFYQCILLLSCVLAVMK
jgi:hypothetical protein